MPEHSTDPYPTWPVAAVGRTFTLLLSPAGPQVALGPAWAVLCGALASGRWQWDAKRLLTMIFVLFIAEASWSTWRALLIDMDWPGYARSHPLPERGDGMLKLPYTTPWSPLGRLWAQVERLRRWARETLPLERRSALLTLPLLPPVTLALSLLAGRPVFILSLAALSLSALEWCIVRRGGTGRSLQAGLEIGLSWLAGHLVFAPLTWVSLTLACCYALAYQGMLSLSRPTLPPGWRAWALALICGGQAAVLAVFVLLKHPWAALALGLLVAPQLLLLPRLAADADGVWYLRCVAPFIAASMAVAAAVVAMI